MGIKMEGKMGIKIKALKMLFMGVLVVGFLVLFSNILSAEIIRMLKPDGTFVYVNSSNPLPISGDITITDNVVYDTQLEQFKFTGNDLNVIFSNSSISTDATLTDTSISVDNTVTVELNEGTTTDTCIWVTCTSENTEYSLTLPAETIRYEVICTGAYLLKLAWDSGASATAYYPIKSGTAWNSFDCVGYNHASKTIYMQSTTAGAVACVHCLLKP